MFVLLLLFGLVLSDDASITCDEMIFELCPLTEDTGSIKIREQNLKYYVYTSEVADVWKLPLLVVNGGPGCSHKYLSTIKKMACFGRKIIFYDQVGSGASDRPSYKTAPWLWDNLDTYYSEEIDALLTHLNIAEFHLLGHSWGGIVAQYYAFKQTPNLKGLLLASTLSDAQLYIDGQREFLHASLPPYIQYRLHSIEQNKTFNSPLYRKIEELLTYFWTVRTTPMPDCVRTTFETMNRDIYVAIQGESEFTVGGKLEFMNLTSRLSSIQVPTLITSGRFDTMTPPVIETLLDGIQGSQYYEFVHSGHMTMIDDVNDFVEVMEGFLIAIDINQTTPEALEAKALFEQAEAENLASSVGDELSQMFEEGDIRDEL